MAYCEDPFIAGYLNPAVLTMGKRDSSRKALIVTPDRKCELEELPPYPNAETFNEERLGFASTYGTIVRWTFGNFKLSPA